ncbi:MAG: DPP IV N-terminal domain-containing protein [Balneolaceae bacterium]
MKRYVLWILLSLISFEMAAQGFNSINNRNHPYLAWQTAETEHFEIMIPDRLIGMEAWIAAIAEESYEVLSGNLGVEFDRKIRMYLSDVDEINNGFAVPFGNGYTHIWVNVNDYAEQMTGSEKWLRRVIAHELAHIFHYEAVRTNLGLWNYVVGSPASRVWTEGLAQYQTEKWDAQRGDRWLRMAIFDSRPDYSDNESYYNPLLMYASGNSQVRYFAETYGDSTLARLLSHREDWIGPFQYYDSGKAFRKTIDKSYDEFYEEWLKHMNVFYYSQAMQMDRVDSLGATPEQLPGQYYFDLEYSPDRSRIAVLSLHSLQRPVRQLAVVQNDSTRNSRVMSEGPIRAGLDWSPDGTSLAYARRVRGRNSSLVNDLFLLDTESGKEERLTHSRKARYPAFSPGGNEIAYIVNENGTGNIFIRHLDNKRERRITCYPGDTQLIHLEWNRERNQLVFQRFNEEGRRELVVLNPDSGEERVLDSGPFDNRTPVVSPDGAQIAFTSLRDDVPNVFIYDLESDSVRRVTRLFTGAEVLDWLTASDSDNGLRAAGQLVLKATETKRREEVYLIDAGTSARPLPPGVKGPYTTWKSHTPPLTFPDRIEPDKSLIEKRYPYNSLKNISHVLSFAFPYFQNESDWGIAGFTGWTEPLGKHLVSGGGVLSLADPTNSYGIITYVNNQYYPSILFNVYRTPGRARFYVRNFLFDEMTGTDVSAIWPLDRFESSYRRSRLGVRLRYTSIKPYTLREYKDSPLIAMPEEGRQMDLRLSWRIKKQRPYIHNVIHPLDGYGIRVMATGAEKIFGSEISFFTTDFSAYTLLPAPGRHRIYLYGRFQSQFGEPLPQNFIGFSRYDNIDLPLHYGAIYLQTYENDRVRGFREFAAGKHVAFASAEYRIPFLPSLQTTILGFLKLGPTSFTLFADAGLVLEPGEIVGRVNRTRRLGVGSEIKNRVSMGPFQFIHSVGLAQPHYDLTGFDNYDLYYRVKASVPF